MFLVRVLAVAVAAHLVFLAFETLLAQSERAPRAGGRHDPAARARLFWGLAVAAGGLLPLALLLMGVRRVAVATTVAAVLALAGRVRLGSTSGLKRAKAFPLLMATDCADLPPTDFGHGFHGLHRCIPDERR